MITVCLSCVNCQDEWEAEIEIPHDFETDTCPTCGEEGIQNFIIRSIIE